MLFPCIVRRSPADVVSPYGYGGPLGVGPRPPLDAFAPAYQAWCDESGEKADILKAIFDTKDRSSVLGTYSIDENGDTSLTDYGVYTIEGGELKFDSTIKAAAG